MEILILTLSFLNSALLTAVFVAQIMGREKLVRRLGLVYLFLAIPGIAALILTTLSGAKAETLVFLSLFLAYLLIEWLYDYALKLEFRRNWKLLVPYAALYISMNYGFFVMSFRLSRGFGIAVLVLTVLQITANLITHKRKPAGN